MKKIKTKQMVKMNLSLENDFYELLKEKANQDYIKVATWTKQYLKKALLTKNNKEEDKCLTKNGTTVLQ